MTRHHDRTINGKVVPTRTEERHERVFTRIWTNGGPAARWAKRHVFRWGAPVSARTPPEEVCEALEGKSSACKEALAVKPAEGAPIEWTWCWDAETDDLLCTWRMAYVDIPKH